MAKKTTLLSDALKLMGEEKELHVFKGVLMNPVKTMKDDGTWYFVFELKCLKNFGTDSEYGQSYNLFHMLIPADLAQEYRNEDIQALKGNEVIVLAATRCSVRKKEDSKFNSISFFVQEIEFSRKVALFGPTVLKKVESL